MWSPSSLRPWALSKSKWSVSAHSLPHLPLELCAKVLLHVLQIDVTFGVGLLAVPPVLALCFWAVMRALLMRLGGFEFSRCFKFLIRSAQVVSFCGY